MILSKIHFHFCQNYRVEFLPSRSLLRAVGKRYLGEYDWVENMIWWNGFELYFIFSFLWSRSIRSTVCLNQKYQMFFRHTGALLAENIASQRRLLLVVCSQAPFCFFYSQPLNFTVPLLFCIAHCILRNVLSAKITQSITCENCTMVCCNICRKSACIICRLFWKIKNFTSIWFWNKHFIQ